MSYCANCGKQVSDTANFCPHCGAKVARVTNPGHPTAPNASGGNSGGNQTPSPKPTPGIKASNFFIPILIMFGGGWIGGIIARLFMPDESLAHVASLVYAVLSCFYVYLCYSSLENKESNAATSRSIFVLLSGAPIVILTFLAYASDSIVLAGLLFFVALVIMIVDSILDTITPKRD